ERLAAAEPLKFAVRDSESRTRWDWTPSDPACGARRPDDAPELPPACSWSDSSWCDRRTCDRVAGLAARTQAIYVPIRTPTCNAIQSHRAFLLVAALHAANESRPRAAFSAPDAGDSYPNTRTPRVPGTPGSARKSASPPKLMLFMYQSIFRRV